MTEIFKRFYKEYEISNFGNCRRLLKNNEYKIINGALNKKVNGYKYLDIYEGKERKRLYFHHLVAHNFIGIRPLNFHIDHIDRNSLNNNVCNLRYVTPRENSQNTVKYRTDILTQDRRERNNVFRREYYNRKKLKNIIIFLVLYAKIKK